MRAESSVERTFVSWCKRHGYLAFKLNVRGRRGWPDRMVLMPGGRMIFVELKRRGGALTDLQAHVHRVLAQYGFTVRVFDGQRVF